MSTILLLVCLVSCVAPCMCATSAAETIIPELLTTAEAARLVNVGERTLWRWSRSGDCPAPVRIGGAVRYRREEYLAWIKAGCPRCHRRGAQ
ncbi:MAG: helix-turn-helix transcriptional regulator [Pirellulales bacterium]